MSLTDGDPRFRKNSGDIASKARIRNWAVEQLGGKKKTRVLELFGGEGVMHDRCYVGVDKHLAFDIRKIDRPTWLHGDTRVLLPIHVNDGFNLYDADAYTLPWVSLADVCRLRKPGAFIVVATDGTLRGLKSNANGYLRKVSGLNDLKDNRLAIRWHDDIVRWVVQDWERFKTKPKACVRLRSIRSWAWYYGIVLEKH
jgi:hypothetical protein